MSTFTKGTSQQQAQAQAKLTAAGGFEFLSYNGMLLARMPGRSYTGSLNCVNEQAINAAFAGAFLSNEGWVIVCFPN